MKKYYYLACVLLSWLASAVNAQPSNAPAKVKTVSDVENRTVYCALFGDQTIEGYGMSSFQTGAQDKISLLHKWGDMRFIFSGAAANGEYYAFFYVYDNGGANMSDTFSKVNLRTGEEKVIKDWSDFDGKLQDMTYDYSTNTMYAVGFMAGVSSLFTVDLETGDRTKGPEFTTNTGSHNLSTLAATYDGRLYGTDLYGVLYQVDKETGFLDSIMDLKQTVGPFQSIEFDHTDESLYYATSGPKKMDVGVDGNDRMHYLLKIDVEKRTFKSLGVLGGDEGTVVTGLYIPYVLAGFDAPGMVSDIKVIAGSEGKEEALISWKNPTKTHGGDELKGDVSVALERDGEVISSAFGQPGEVMSWNDKGVKKGEHKYQIRVSNAIGEGVRNDIDAYVGPDVPDYVKDLAITAGDNCKSIKLKWNIPEKGAHGGYYDKSNVRFKIVRYPDQKVLEESFAGESYEDNTMKRLGAYSYGITATNAAGSNNEYVSKNTVVAGKEENIPYLCAFENPVEVSNKWTVLDAGKDGWGISISTGWGSVFFQDITFSAEYVMPQYEMIDADEWLISPPLNFDINKRYYISFDTRSWGIDEFNVTAGRLNNIESQTQYVSHGVFTVDGSEDDTKSFQNHKYQLPLLDGIHCLGINLVTAYGDSQFFQLNNLEIAEGVVGIESASAETSVKVMLNGDRLIVEGNFKIADVYSATGVQVASLNEQNAQVTTTGWLPGLYIVKVTNADSVYTQKIMVK